MVQKTISFEKAIDKSHKQLISQLKNLLNTIGNLKLSDEERVKQANAQCLNIVRHCNTLQDILVPEDRPDWLIQILSNCKKYMNSGFEANPFNALYQNYPQVLSYEWNFTSYIEGIDFDSIYQNFKDESELPKLLDELVLLLEKLINESGEEIQAKTLNDLTRLLNTVIQNKNGSSTAIESTLFLIFEFFKNSFFTVFPAIQITADGIKTIKKIGTIIGKSIDENRNLRAKVIEKTEKSLSNSITYTADAKIENQTIIPKNVLEHYTDKKV